MVTPGRGEAFGVTLEESYGENGSSITAPVSTATPVQAGRVVDALFVAIRKAGHQPSVLAFKRKAPIRLGEAEGVRLALVLFTTQPIAKHERVRALVAGRLAVGQFAQQHAARGVDAQRLEIVALRGQHTTALRGRRVVRDAA